MQNSSLYIVHVHLQAVGVSSAAASRSLNDAPTPYPLSSCQKMTDVCATITLKALYMNIEHCKIAVGVQ